MNIATMTPTTRKKLVQMACVAAWSDLEIRPEERRAIFDLATQLALPGADLAEIKDWLSAPPPDFDPYDIPNEHRQAFLEAFLEIVTADGRIDPEESEAIRLLRELVA